MYYLGYILFGVLICQSAGVLFGLYIVWYFNLPVSWCIIWVISCLVFKFTSQLVYNSGYILFGILIHQSAGLFSSPEHEVLMVSYCGQSMSVVHRPSCVVNNCFKSLLLLHPWAN